MRTLGHHQAADRVAQHKGLAVSVVQSLWHWLTTSTSRSTATRHPDLAPLDPAQLAKDLDLLPQAQRLGAAGLPAPDAKQPSGPEAAVVQRIDKARQDCIDWAQLRLNLLSQQLAQRSNTQDINNAAQADQEFQRQASALLTEQSPTLRALADAAARRQAELATFRNQHGLQRDAHYPSPTGSYLRYALVLLLIVVEGVLNARFFAQGLDTGLLGGFSQAGILAAANVMIAFAFGKFAVRYLHHAQRGLALLGWAALATALAVMTALALGIAHYRDSLVADLADPARLALQAAAAHPFALRDFFSWALFAISAAFGVAALLDGLSSDDPYPGYGPLSRRAQAAADDQAAELAMLRADLEALKESSLQQLASTVQQAQKALALAESLVSDKLQAAARLATALRDADQVQAALLGRFRTENELHRQGVPRPAYFDQAPDPHGAQALQLPESNTATDEASLASQRAQLQALLDDEQAIRARIQAAFNQQFDQLTPLGAHFQAGAAAKVGA